MLMDLPANYLLSIDQEFFFGLGTKFSICN